MAPLVAWRDAEGEEAGAPRTVVAVAPRDPRATRRVAPAVRERNRPSLSTPPVPGRDASADGPGRPGGSGANEARACPGKTFRVRRDPQGIRQLGPTQRAAQRGVVAKLGVAQDGVPTEKSIWHAQHELTGVEHSLALSRGAPKASLQRGAFAVGVAPD